MKERTRVYPEVSGLAALSEKWINFKFSVTFVERDTVIIFFSETFCVKSEIQAQRTLDMMCVQVALLSACGV
jgi:hypothetical protein